MKTGRKGGRSIGLAPRKPSRMPRKWNLIELGYFRKLYVLISFKNFSQYSNRVNTDSRKTQSRITLSLSSGHHSLFSHVNSIQPLLNISPEFSFLAGIPPSQKEQMDPSCTSTLHPYLLPLSGSICLRIFARHFSPSGTPE